MVDDFPGCDLVWIWWKSVSSLQKGYTEFVLKDDEQ